ncbi:AbrB/MazE/SpoVT family DNA-binding domain-containing protein [Candidatus Pacearchaeota archaeon]|nr:AbrB/MazE/SpoVT family DNA-binding domain-containing protein [Candidatus Pacearchaeota archaeon]
MKLQKRFLRKHKNKDYYKYIVNIPPLMVREAGFEEGEELDIDAKTGKIILKKKKER